MKIIAKILINEDVKILEVSNEDYVLIEDNFKIGSQTLLRRQGYQAGKFQITYYNIIKEKLFNNSFVLSDISSDKKQCKCKLSEDVQFNIIDLLEQQKRISDKINYTRLVGYNGNKINQFGYIVYNQFKQEFILKSQQVIQFTKRQVFNVHQTQYEPINQTIIMMKEKVQVQNTQKIVLSSPYFYQDNLTTESFTDFLSLSDLIDSQNYLNIQNKIIYSDMKETVYYNYKEPKQFVHFGSYLSRVTVLRQKYNKLLQYQTTNNIVDNITTTMSLQYLNHKQYYDIINNLNTFQRQIINNQLTNKIENKVSLIDNNNFWWNNLIDEAKEFDKQNIHCLINFIPEAIRHHRDNKDLITLVNLMGDMFDQYWAAIKTIPILTSKLESQLEFLNQTLLIDLLKNMGQQYVKSFTDKSLKQTYLKFTQLNKTDISFDKYNKTILSRLVANLPFILRMKGTRSALQQILNIFGFDSNLINITQYIKGNNNKTIVYNDCQFSQLFRVGITSPTKFYSLIDSDWENDIGYNIDKNINNASSIHIGTYYSNEFNNQFVNQYSGSLNNLIDNSQEDLRSLYYTKLQNEKYSTTTSFKKYPQLLNAYQSIDDVVFTMLDEFIPTNVFYSKGLILDNNILNRNKIPSIQMNNSLIKKQEIPTLCSKVYLKSDNIKKIEKPIIKLKVDLPQQTINSKTNQLVVDLYDYGFGKNKHSAKELIHKFYVGDIFSLSNQGQAIVSIKRQERSMIIDQDKKLTVTSIKL